MWYESDDYDFPPPRMRYNTYRPGPSRQFNYPPYYPYDSDTWDSRDWDSRDWDSDSWDPSQFRAHIARQRDLEARDNLREEGPSTCFTFRVYLTIGIGSFLVVGIVIIVLVVKGMENPYG